MNSVNSKSNNMRQKIGEVGDRIKSALSGLTQTLKSFMADLTSLRVSSGLTGDNLAAIFSRLSKASDQEGTSSPSSKTHNSSDEVKIVTPESRPSVLESKGLTILP